MYFSYHSIVQKGIKQGRLKSYYFDKNYKKIGYVMVLCFGKKSIQLGKINFWNILNLLDSFTKLEKKEMCFTQLQFNIANLQNLAF